MTNFKTPVLAAVLAWCAAGAQAGSIHDTFSDGAMLIQSDTAPYVEAYTASAEAPGGGRYIAAVVAQNGKFTFSAVQAGAYFTLVDAAMPLYTNLSYGVANFFGQDLSLNLLSESAFKLDFLYITAPMSLYVGVITAHGGGAPSSLAEYAVALTPSFAQTVTVPFSALVNSAVNPSAVDWSDIDGITFIVSGPGASGFALDTFSTQAVPEPETVSLMLAGLALVASLSRRRVLARS